MKQALFIGAIASIIAINSVIADTVVTSRGYVDAADALKQDKITAGTTGNVVTYNGTQNGQAQFSERAIFDPATGLDGNDEVVSGHEGDLVTAGLIIPGVNQLYQQITDLGEQIPQDGFYQQRAMTPPTCAETASNGDCLLWSIGSVIYVFSPNDWGGVCSLDGETCRDASTCCGGGCNSNTHTCYTAPM